MFHLLQTSDLLLADAVDRELGHLVAELRVGGVLDRHRRDDFHLAEHGSLERLPEDARGVKPAFADKGGHLVLDEVRERDRHVAVIGDFDVVVVVGVAVAGRDYNAIFVQGVGAAERRERRKKTKPSCEGLANKTNRSTTIQYDRTAGLLS